MNRPGYYETKGKQEVLFGNSTVGGILLITVLFLLNAALIFGIDSFLIHNIPGEEGGVPALEGHIPGSVLSMEKMDGGYLILYAAESGETKVAKATENVMGRYHLNLDVATITEEPHTHNGALLDFTVENGEITKAANITILNARNTAWVVIGLCFLVTALERMLFEKLRGQ